MSEAFDKAKAAELAAKEQLVAQGVPLAAPTVEPRKRRTAEERLAAEREKIAALQTKVDERKAKDAERAAKEELARKRKVLAGLDAYCVSCVSYALGFAIDADSGDGDNGYVVGMMTALSALRGEVAGE